MGKRDNDDALAAASDDQIAAPAPSKLDEAHDMIERHFPDQPEGGALDNLHERLRSFLHELVNHLAK